MDKRVILFVLFSLLNGIEEVKSLTINWDPACGVTKGCFPACQTGCDYLVTWQETNGSGIKFELQAKATDINVYLALGFSDDYRMGDDGVVSCIVPNGLVESSYNNGDKNEKVLPKTLGLSNFAVTQSNGIISCNFTRAYETSEARLKYLNKDYILMLVVGPTENKHGELKMKQHNVLPWTSDGTVDLNSNTVVRLYKMNTPLVKAHGSLMYLAWMVFSTVGIVTARYNKGMFPLKTLLGTKIWFQVHRGCMVLTLLCVVIAFIIIFVHINGYSQIVSLPSRSVTNSHPVLGIIITVLTLLNPIMALFRPDPDHKMRWMFNWAHFGVGVISQLLAVITIFFGSVLERAMLPDSALYVLVAHLLALMVSLCVLEIHRWKQKKMTNDVQMKTKTEDENDKSNDSSNLVRFPVHASDTLCGHQRDQMFPVYVMIFLMVYTLALATGILVIIARS